MTSLSTHVLDTAHGQPARGMKLSLWHDGARLYDGATDDDGRCLGLGAGKSFAAGAYKLQFHVADYFRAQGVTLPDPPFLGLVSIDFGIADDGHYHVPLLVSPFAYSTYRGS
ncbi:hydroxyisourate hydrolase [Sphingomonas sp.]|jgi:5-hydroxyisourate hydrolase|uniref:hydroxyisourate hydrolase n=1 Tax=Sphingomonas sp. TaxID=28214 RepID=UPI002E2F3458|nr:hydroxyisourate hydrolase [Sphingomonas sp.]HEX4695214.1 hydroxyisourate hydrolase [Sphingomonas sp.]